MIHSHDQTSLPPTKPNTIAIVARTACGNQIKFTYTTRLNLMLCTIYSGRLTAMAQAMYPGFSRGLILAHTRMNIPMYHGIAPKMKPVMNLQE